MYAIFDSHAVKSCENLERKDSSFSNTVCRVCVWLLLVSDVQTQLEILYAGFVYGY